MIGVYWNFGILMTNLNFLLTQRCSNSRRVDSGHPGHRSLLRLQIQHRVWNSGSKRCSNGHATNDSAILRENGIRIYDHRLYYHCYCLLCHKVRWKLFTKIILRGTSCAVYFISYWHFYMALKRGAVYELNKNK